MTRLLDVSSGTVYVSSDLAGKAVVNLRDWEGVTPVGLFAHLSLQATAGKVALERALESPQQQKWSEVIVSRELVIFGRITVVG